MKIKPIAKNAYFSGIVYKCKNLNIAKCAKVTKRIASEKQQKIIFSRCNSLYKLLTPIRKEMYNMLSVAQNISYFDGISKDETETKIDVWDIKKIAFMYVNVKLRFKIRDSRQKKTYTDKETGKEFTVWENGDYTNFFADLKKQGTQSQKFIRSQYHMNIYCNTEVTHKLTKRKTKAGTWKESIKTVKKQNALCVESEKNFLNYNTSDFDNIYQDAILALCELWTAGKIVNHSDFFENETFKKVCNAVQRGITRESKHTSFNPKNAFSLNEKITSQENDETGEKIDSITPDNLLLYLSDYDMIDDKDFYFSVLDNMQEKQANCLRKVFRFLPGSSSINGAIEKAIKEFKKDGIKVSKATIYRYFTAFSEQATKDFQEILKEVKA